MKRKIAKVIVGAALSALAASQAAFGNLDSFEHPGARLDLADITFVGEGTGSRAGLEVVDAGDVDGDGLRDVLVAADLAGDGTRSWVGKTYLFLGRRLIARSGALDLSMADAVFVGEAAGDRCGSSIAGVGDVNGDGLDDFMISTPWASVGVQRVGKSYLFLGDRTAYAGRGAVNASTARVKFIGEFNNDFSGDLVAKAGDIDQDGKADILIGAPGANSSRGNLYVVCSSDLMSRPEWGLLPARSFNFLLGSSSYIFTGEPGANNLSKAAAGVGDVDGDGRDDILVGAPFAGKTYLLTGKQFRDWRLAPVRAPIRPITSAACILTGENALDYSGSSLAAAGDLDGDGLQDVLIGAPRYDVGPKTDAGCTYLVFGRRLKEAASRGEGTVLPLAEADFKFLGEEAGDQSGYSVAAATNRIRVDIPGIVDLDLTMMLLAIGAPFNDQGGADAGKTYIVPWTSELAGSLEMDALMDLRSMPLNDAATHSCIGERAGDYSGGRVAVVKDINRDRVSRLGVHVALNLPEVLIGAYRAGVSGKAYLVYSPTFMADELGSIGDWARPGRRRPPRPEPPGDIWVDAAATVGGSGTAARPFRTINEGIEAAYFLARSTGGEPPLVFVKSGRYSQSVRLRENVKVYGVREEDQPPPVISLGKSSANLVEGASGAAFCYFVIEGGVRLHGVYRMVMAENAVVASGGVVPLVLSFGSSDNIIMNNLLVHYADSSLAPETLRMERNSRDNLFINNTLHAVGAGDRSAVGVLMTGGRHTGNIFRNNILHSEAASVNQAIGFSRQVDAADTSVLTIEYNKTPALNQNITLSADNMINSTSPRFQSPLLRSATIYDFGRWTRTPWYTGYALRGTSPCVNRGHPDADYNDQNGTRNDMGAFGGPNGFDFRPGW